MGLITLFKRVAVISLLVMAVTYFTKDSLPTPDYYDNAVIQEPIQKKSAKNHLKLRSTRNDTRLRRSMITVWRVLW